MDERKMDGGMMYRWMKERKKEGKMDGGMDQRKKER